MNTIAGAPDARAQLAALIFAVLLLDEDDNIVEANHAAEEMLGRSARKLCEKRFWDVIGISDERLSERLATVDAQVIARGVTIADIDLTVKEVDGNRIATIELKTPPPADSEASAEQAD